MVRTKSYVKHIACLESFWTYDVENRVSVTPILDLLSKTNGTRSITLTCNTIEELNFNLEIAKRMRGYRILYLAFHGFPGGIYMPDLKINMESLAKLMGKGFWDWIVFFDSCRTMSVGKDRIFNFMKATGVLMVMGYKKDVNWLEGVVLDLLILNGLQYYRQMRSFWSDFKKSYTDLVKTTGLEVYQR